MLHNPLRSASEQDMLECTTAACGCNDQIGCELLCQLTDRAISSTLHNMQILRGDSEFFGNGCQMAFRIANQRSSGRMTGIASKIEDG